MNVITMVWTYINLLYINKMNGYLPLGTSFIGSSIQVVWKVPKHFLMQKKGQQQVFSVKIKHIKFPNNLNLEIECFSSNTLFLKG